MATAAAASGSALLGARRDAVGAAMALARADALRAGPCAGGTDTAAAAGVTYAGAWSCTSGRGRPDAIHVDVAWPGHHLSLATETLR